MNALHAAEAEVERLRAENLRQAKLIERLSATARRLIKLRDVSGDLCEDCGAEILPDVCGCGSELRYHGWGDGHQFVPMGCNCYRDTGEGGA